MCGATGQQGSRERRAEEYAGGWGSNSTNYDSGGGVCTVASRVLPCAHHEPLAANSMRMHLSESMRHGAWLVYTADCADSVAQRL